MKPLRPYLYHAYYSWIIDNDNTPYLLVNTDYPDVDVPTEFIRDGKIILNIAPRSIGQYVVTDEAIRLMRVSKACYETYIFHLVH
ncbi:ClpXP protease specificity-enhancing factor [Actinobacillus equuli]|nr:ClpXP protease specificity-enhancing factor [Actinobacillus equuli]